MWNIRTMLGIWLNVEKYQRHRKVLQVTTRFEKYMKDKKHSGVALQPFPAGPSFPLCSPCLLWVLICWSADLQIFRAHRALYSVRVPRTCWWAAGGQLQAAPPNSRGSRPGVGRRVYCTAAVTEEPLPV